MSNLIQQLSLITGFSNDIVYCILISFMFGVLGWINRFVPINFGRHLQSVTRINIPNKIAWMIFEGPNLFNVLYFIPQAQITSIYNYILLAPFFIHYIHRVIIYPLRNPSNKPIPLEICLSAFLFTSANSYMQCKIFLITGKVYSEQIFYSLNFWVGLIVFIYGMYINIRSDDILGTMKRQILQKQQKGDKKEYQIPRGFYFEYVSSANYFGEIVEWIGYAIMSLSFQGFWFALFTLSYLSARGIDNHNWYLKNFRDYPKTRKAVLPFLV